MSEDLDRLVSLMVLQAETRIRRNYIVPGLSSVYLGGTAAGGMLRLFTMDRDQESWVVPHTHRYDFQARVLAGYVDNILYSPVPATEPFATHAALMYLERERRLVHESPQFMRASGVERRYATGEWYRMAHDEYHSIRFSRGARVLMVEGKQVNEHSFCLLPYSAGELCDNFYWKNWMMREERK